MNAKMHYFFKGEHLGPHHISDKLPCLSRQIGRQAHVFRHGRVLGRC